MGIFGGGEGGSIANPLGFLGGDAADFGDPMNLFHDPNAGEQKRLQAALDRMKKAYEAYRPQVQAAHMNNRNQQLGAFNQSVNPFLVMAGGPEMAVNTGLLGQNPMQPNLPQGAPPPMDNAPGGGQAPPGAFVSQGGAPAGSPTPFPQDVANRRIVDDARQAQANRNRKTNPFHNPGQ